jgi:hypothetical protein
MYGFFSIAEVALLCQRPYVTVYNHATAGRLGPVKKQGRLYFLTPEGVAAYQASLVEKAKRRSSKK